MIQQSHSWAHTQTKPWFEKIHAPLFTTAQTWKQFKHPSTNEWIKKDMECIYNGLLSHKKNEIMSFAVTWVDLEIIILSEISQKEKDRQRKTNAI